MTEPTDSAPPANDDEPLPPDDQPPDESTMMGMPGVETEVLAEAARAEAELADPAHEPGDDELEGAEV
jgi:hypothetical protein